MTIQPVSTNFSSASSLKAKIEQNTNNAVQDSIKQVDTHYSMYYTIENKEDKDILDILNGEKPDINIENPDNISRIKDKFKKDDEFDNVSKEDKESIDNLVKGEQEIETIKDEYKETMKKLGYTDEEIEEMLPSLEDKYLEENPDYAEAKDKFGDLQEKHDNYMDKKMKEWQKNNPVPDYDASKEEWDKYYERREEYEADLNKVYSDENPEYAYYDYKKNNPDSNSLKPIGLLPKDLVPIQNYKYKLV